MKDEEEAYALMHVQYMVLPIPTLTKQDVADFVQVHFPAGGQLLQMPVAARWVDGLTIVTPDGLMGRSFGCSCTMFFGVDCSTKRSLQSLFTMRSSMWCYRSGSWLTFYRRMAS